MAEKINDIELEEVSGGVYTGSVFRYTIQPGDTLSGIALRYGTTVSTLVAINNISNPNYIRAYDTILVPYGAGQYSTGYTAQQGTNGNLVYVSIA